MSESLKKSSILEMYFVDVLQMFITEQITSIVGYGDHINKVCPIFLRCFLPTTIKDRQLFNCLQIFISLF